MIIDYDRPTTSTACISDDGQNWAGQNQFIPGKMLTLIGLPLADLMLISKSECAFHNYL